VPGCYAGPAVRNRAGAWAVAPLALFLPVFAVIDRRVIRWEERNLAAKFGAPYLDYLSRVPRWI